MASIKELKRKKGIVWQVQVHRKELGKTYTRVFKNKTDAIAWGRDLDSRVDKGTVIGPVSKALTVAQAVEDYLEEAEVRDKDKGAYGTILLDMGAKSIKGLSPETLQTWVNKLLKTEVPKQVRTKAHPLYHGDESRTYAQSTVRKFFYVLKKVLVWHAKKKHYALDSELFKIKVPAAWGNKAGRRISKDEEKKLLASAKQAKYHPESWVRLISLALDTGCRLQELVKATKKDVVIRNDKITALNVPVENSKTETERLVALTGSAKGIIEAELKIVGEKPLFSELGNPQSISAGFHIIAVRAGVPVRFHDLRHEATSRMAESGIFQLHELMKHTGHTEMTTFQGYVKLLPQEMEKKMQKFGRQRRIDS